MGRGVNTIINADRKKYLFNCDAYIIRVDNFGYLVAPWLRSWHVFNSLIYRTSYRMRDCNTFNVLVTYMLNPSPKIVFMCKTTRDGSYNIEQLKKIRRYVSNQTVFYTRLAAQGSEIIDAITKNNRKFYIRNIYADCDPDDTKSFRAFNQWRGKVFLDLDTPICIGGL